jgi:hypothetical protein
MLTMYRAAQITNEALKSVKPLIIHKYWLRTQRIVEAYQLGQSLEKKSTRKRSTPITGEYGLQRLKGIWNRPGASK